MVRRSTWIVLAIFLIVLAAAWGFQRYQTQKAAEITPTSSTEKLLEIQENTLANLRVENDQGKVLVLGRNVEGLWEIIEPVGGGETDTGRAESAVTQLLSVRSQFNLEMPENLDEYGLLNPSYTIVLTLNGGEKYILRVGSEAPAVSGYYIQLDGAAPQVVSKFSLDPILEMIAKPPYKPTETPTPLPEMSETPDASLEGTETPFSSETPASVDATGTPTPAP